MELAPDLCCAVFNSFSEHIAILEPDGSIKAVNAAWESYTQSNGGSLQQTGVGNNYLQICDESARSGDDDAAIVGQNLEQILQGRMNHFCYEYPCHSPTQRQWYIFKCWPLPWQGSTCAVVSHRDATESVLVREELRLLLLTNGYPELESGSLAEHLFSHHSLNSLEQLLVQDSNELLKRRWKLSDEQCKQQIELALYYIKQD